MNAPPSLLTKLDRCVACGMCLPVCPTYRLSKSESDSPRGRIALMRGILRGELRLSPMVASHLDGCLTCRACETICPANVPYGEVIDETRAAFPMDRVRPLSARLLARMLRGLVSAGPCRWRLAAWLARAGKFLPTIRRRLNRKPIRDTHEAHALPSATVLDALGTHQGDVALFLGCIARITDHRTIHDSIYVLRRLGYRVHLPPQQRCCGALHWHQGDRPATMKLARKNITAFSLLDVKHVVSTTTACTAMLRDYGTLYPEDSAAIDLAKRVVDITELLARQGKIDMTKTQLRVAVHEPCSARFALSQTATTKELLAHIPGLQLTALPKDTGCCGAAGAHQFLRPKHANALRATTLAAIADIDPDVVVTTNVGCAMHLRSGLEFAGARCDVLHPVSLIAQQLQQMQPTENLPT